MCAASNDSTTPDAAVTRPPVVIVDDNGAVLQMLAAMLRSGGIEPVICLADERELLPLLDRAPVSLVLLDLVMPYIDGEELLNRINEHHPEVPVIVVSGTADVDTAVRCIRHGAYDYLVKPVSRDRLVTTLGRALEVADLRDEVGRLRERLLSGRPSRPELFADIVTEDTAMLALFNYIEAVARSPQPILVYGETGTGKDLVAHAIHACSGATGELVPVNVAGLDDTAFSDTLFGHARGAFTGAERARDGLVAAAAGGTLFLDEIGDLATESQVKLLRLLQNHSFYPLGSDRQRNSTARIVAATNRDLREAVSNGRFRPDLYYRLRTHSLRLPPLRERRGDIALLLGHLVKSAAAAMGKAVPAIAPATVSVLQHYDYPGNVRELEAMVFDAVATARSTRLEPEHFAIPGGAGEAGPPDGSALEIGDPMPTLAEAEERLLDEALRRAGNNQRVAARMLGISRQALNKRLSRRRD